jgi:hypothetical protein
MKIKNLNFIAAMGLGAFLIFFIQPLISKAILPYLGGSSSIWATSLVFFTVFLFLGYLYTFVLSHFKIKTQIFVHSILLFFSLATISVNFYFNTPLFLPVEWFVNSGSPVWSVLSFLTVCVGLPYIFLASTAPLIQNWYVIKEKAEPYKLYTISNAGSLLGLVLFPLFLERHLDIYNNTIVWSVLFVIYTYILFLIIRIMSKLKAEETASSNPILKFIQGVLKFQHWFQNLSNSSLKSLLLEFKSSKTREFIWWTLVATIPSALLVAATTFVTQVIAPIPLLWIVPLVLYLLSFIVAFSGVRLSPTVFLLALIFVGQILLGSFFNLYGSINHIYVVLVCFFFVSTSLHQYMYLLRPEKERSSIYYVALSLGGALGTILVSIFAPYYLKDYIEMHLLLSIGALVIFIVAIRYFLSSQGYVWEKVFLGICAVVFSATYLQSFVEEYKLQAETKSRNFYGVTEISDYEDKRQLNHGNTLHGEQYFDEKLRLVPTLYYSYESGVGRSVLAQQAAKKNTGLNIGVIGLGTGTMGAYCREKDSFDFFEIDERIKYVALNAFSYLEKCKNYKIILGDGRIKMQEIADGKYDVLAIDAFSDDSIPMHMVTKEAIEIFMSKVKGDGILAVHTSNRYIDLGKVVVKIADELSIPVVVIGGGDENLGSVWILLSKNKDLLTNQVIRGKLEKPDNKTPLWTDGYTNIFPVMYQKIFSGGEESEEGQE